MGLFEQAKKYIPGGVNSPVRSFQAVGGTPVFIKKGQGAKIFGEKGKTYLDYCLSWGAMILGHAHPEVTKAVAKAIKRGTSFGAPTKIETELAKTISQAVLSIERLRLVNSGTEAVMTAIRLARAFTKKKVIIKFSGSYHGHADFLLSCPGVLDDFKRGTLTVPYNDLKAVEQAIRTYQGDVAAIIVEPIAANMGVILPNKYFLADLRDITAKHGILLIFDEVITGFRFCFGGVQDMINISPDLTCLGKIIGGGFPIGAVGGKVKIMEQLAPAGKVYQAGTFSGNPVSVTAGLTALNVLSTGMHYQQMQLLARKLCQGIERLAGINDCKLKVNSFGSIFSLFFTDREIVDHQSANNQDEEIFKKYYHGLLKKGIYLSPSGYEANFISIQHKEIDINTTLAAFSSTFKKMRRDNK